MSENKPTAPSTPKFNLFLQTSDSPRIINYDEQVWSRIKYIPFNPHFGNNPLP